MVTLLLGSDDFSKKLYLADLAKTADLEVEYFFYENVSDLSKLTETDLFGQKKVFVLTNCVTKTEIGERLENFLSSSNEIVFLEEKLDKRLSETKQLLANTKIVVKEFLLPEGVELKQWIAKRIHALNGKIQSDVLEIFFRKFENTNSQDFESTSSFSLWQVDSEIHKLLHYSKGQNISAEAVENLVTTELETSIFKISDALAKKNKQELYKLLNQFFSDSSYTEQKVQVMQLSAFLAEQFRNILAVKNLQAKGESFPSIAKKASWKNPNRALVLGKFAENFSEASIVSFLEKLNFLDSEIKQSSYPPRVVLELVLYQLVS